ALLPLLFLGGRAASEIEQPMALVIVGGLATSTWLNLFVVPAWYARAARGGAAGEGEARDDQGGQRSQMASPETDGVLPECTAKTPAIEPLPRSPRRINAP